MPLKEARFVVLDTETTGFNITSDRILSIGAVGVRQYNVQSADVFEVSIQQQFQKNDSIAIHEITPGIAARATPAAQVFKDFITFIGGDVIIGHYVDFDYQMLSAACKRHLGVGLYNKKYDTMQLLKRTENHFAFTNLHQPEELQLDHVCERFSIPISDRHTAMGDALATALLFMRQLKKLEKRGAKTVGDLLKR